MFSDLSEREVKLQEKNIEYEKLKKKYDDVQNTINEFSKNLDVIAENKKKLLDRLKSLEDMNLLLSNNTFSNIFKEPIVNSSPDATVRDLNKRKSALEDILNSFKFNANNLDGKQQMRYETYQNTINMLLDNEQDLENPARKSDEESDDDNNNDNTTNTVLDF